MSWLAIGQIEIALIILDFFLDTERFLFSPINSFNNLKFIISKLLCKIGTFLCWCSRLCRDKRHTEKRMAEKKFIKMIIFYFVIRVQIAICFYCFQKSQTKRVNKRLAYLFPN